MADVTKIVEAIKELGKSGMTADEAKKAFKEIDAAIETVKGKFGIEINDMRDLIKH